ncbi:hypothetical protein [Brachybacterium sp. J153]|uniref:hypothetical protein n=1 Tax=Brachybacterium sp. J153 TaxID=3116488 RepID=UPI002E767564|nr:hypothetical protein [Brachybacterium sp. J153]MEE1617236.1 hypothetical protein [Brachybacterium sp. J153]
MDTPSDLPPDSSSTSSSSTSVAPAPSPVRRVQVLAVSIAGGLAVLLYLLHLVIGGDAGAGLRSAAVACAVVAALIGVSFAVVGGRR